MFKFFWSQNTLIFDQSQNFYVQNHYEQLEQIYEHMNDNSDKW